MAKLSELSSLDVHYAQYGEDEFLGIETDKRVIGHGRKLIDKARKHTSIQAFEKWCDVDRHRFVDDPPVLVRLDDEGVERFHVLFDRYREALQEDRRHVLSQYRFRDAARRAVGIGSVGLGAYVVLLEEPCDPDPLMIQVKEAVSSVMTPYVGRSGYERHGQRVVVGQRIMQAASDPFIGWAPFADRDYYLRQLRDMKGGRGTSSDPVVFEAGNRIVAATLARAHARSVDPSLLSGYLGRGESFSAGMARYALAYADQAERDHARLERAISDGEIEALTGV